MLDGLSAALVEPFVLSLLGNLNDASIPQMAHSIADATIQAGGLTSFEDNIIFDLDNLHELKTLLNYNLPVKQTEVYKIITEPPQPMPPARIIDGLTIGYYEP